MPTVGGPTRTSILQEVLATEEGVLATLESQIQLLQEKARLQRYFIERLRTHLPTSPARSQPDAVVVSGGQTLVFEAKLSEALSQLHDTASLPERLQAVLHAAGKPMRVSEITAALLPDGSEEQRTRLQSNIVTTFLRRTDVFTKKERGVYALTEWDQPADQVDPRKTDDGQEVLFHGGVEIDPQKSN